MSCSLSHDNSENNTVRSKKEPVQQEIAEQQETVKQEEIVRREETKKNICDIAASIDEYLEELINNPRKIIDFSNDDCALDIMNKLSSNAIELREAKYLKALNSICEISDGYVGEHLMTLVVEQFYRNLEELLSFAEEESCFKKEIILGLSMDVSVGGEKTRKEIESHITKANLSEEKSKIASELLSKIDPSLFD